MSQQPHRSNGQKPAGAKAATPDAHHGQTHGRSHLTYLALAALGVVYGDIGTSPLYAFRESFHEGYDLPPSPANILGVLSLIFWALVLIISVKYLLFVLRADHHGEGGMMALTALVHAGSAPTPYSRRWLLVLLGLFGTALLYGDGVITPAISVLSAVEGLEVATPFFEPYILPITIVILVALFLFQSKGTARVGKVFGPVTLLWFATLAVLGISWIVRHPSVLVAASPFYAVDFFVRNGVYGIWVLGSVFLVVTGGEALYADMGHFGRLPIRLAWFTVVLPALLLNYFGQGALLLEHPEAVHNPFYNMAPAWALYPTVVIATAATVIASQALITGAFSLTMQAMQLGYLPRMALDHTSSSERGQIYIAGINWMLMVLCISLVVAFRSSSNLAAAYGVGVTTDMVVTTLLLYTVMREHWRWSRGLALAVGGFFLVIDGAFWIANLVKIPNGGWFPLVVGVIGFTLFTTWHKGRRILGERLRETTRSLHDIHQLIRRDEVVRVPGTAIYMYSDPRGVPPALVHNLDHNKVLHEQVIFVSVQVKEVPYVSREERVHVEPMRDEFMRVNLYYGYMESPNVPRDLMLARREGLSFDPMKVSYFLGRERLLATNRPGMAQWRERLFAVMSRNSRNATDFFRLPPDRVVELGAQVEL